jgi:hypothetical protein
MAAAGALILFVALLFDWFRPERGGPGGAQSGFNGLGWLLVIVLLLAVVAALTLAALTVTLEPVGLTVTTAVTTTAVGTIATIALAIRLTLGQPDLGAGLADAQVQVLAAAYVGLLGTVLLTAGGWLSMADERTAAPYSAAPDVPARPIPPA